MVWLGGGCSVTVCPITVKIKAVSCNAGQSKSSGTSITGIHVPMVANDSSGAIDTIVAFDVGYGTLSVQMLTVSCTLQSLMSSADSPPCSLFGEWPL